MLRSREKSPRSLKRSRGTGPRATVAGTSRFPVGRGPVPRHATIAEEIRSEPETIAGACPPRYGSQNRPFCSSRAPDLDPIAIRRSQTTEGSAGDRPPRYGPGRKKCAGDRPSPYGNREIAGDRPPRYGIRNGYSRFFNAPNVVSIRFDAETGPGNNRVTNVSRLPSNATSSI